MILYLESPIRSPRRKKIREAKPVEKVAKPELKVKTVVAKTERTGDKNSREENRSRRRTEKTGNNLCGIERAGKDLARPGQCFSR